jgi:hypothetical protein
MSVYAPSITGNGNNAIVATAETTTSATYTDLTTTSDTVTITVGPSGTCLVGVRAQVQNSTAGQASYMSFSGSGANTIVPVDQNSVANTGTNGIDLSCTTLFTAINPGSTTFKAKYKVTGGTGTFSLREIFAIPL